MRNTKGICSINTFAQGKMDASDPFSTPARRRRLVHDIAKGYVFPLTIDAKKRATRRLVRSWAALILQRNIRMFLSTQQLRRMRAALRAQAATRVQAQVRRYLAREELQLRRIEHRKRVRIRSATRMQMAWRWHVTKRRISTRAAINARMRAAVKIQAWVRMHRAVRRYQATKLLRKRVAAARRIQYEWRVVRCRWQRARRQQRQQASNRIGNLMLGLVMQQRAEKVRAARKIQRMVRNALAKMRYAKQLHAFIVELLTKLVVDPVLETVLCSARMQAEHERRRRIQEQERRQEEEARAAMQAEELHQREYEQWLVSTSLKLEPPTPPTTLFTPQASPIKEYRSPASRTSTPTIAPATPESTMPEEAAVEQAVQEALLEQLREESLRKMRLRREATAANTIKQFLQQQLARKLTTAAAVKLQTNWRMALARRMRRRLVHVRNAAAAISIQRVIRGWLAKRRFAAIVQQQIAQHFQDIYNFAQAEVAKLIPSLTVERPSEAQFEVGTLWTQLYSILPLPPAPPGCVPKRLPDVPADFRVPVNDAGVPALLRGIRSKDITTQLLLEITDEHRS